MARFAALQHSQRGEPYEVRGVDGDRVSLQPGVDGLAFERQHAEDAFVHAMERFIADEAFEGFDAEAELSDGEAVFVAEATLAQARELLG